MEAAAGAVIIGVVCAIPDDPDGGKVDDVTGPDVGEK